MQLAVFAVISVIGGSIMGFGYMRLPELLFGVGHYRVTVELTNAAGLYPTGNVTYRGVEVGRIKDVTLTPRGVAAVLALDSAVPIPKDLDAHVHSESAIGEQYVELVPRSGDGPALRNGDVIAADRTSIPPDIGKLLDATDKGLMAIPRDNLRTVVDESYAAFGGLGPELARLVKGSTKLAIDARTNLDSITNLIDNSGPLMRSQVDTSDEIQRWAASIASVSEQLKSRDPDLVSLVKNGPGSSAQARALFERLQPTLPIILMNLVSVADVGVTYAAGLEQLVVLLPSLVEVLQAAGTAAHNTKQGMRGAYLSFNLNVNLPPPCMTGYLPAQQARVSAHEDYPDRPEGELYCRIPQDAMFNVRGARNLPCETRPGKRAPTAAMCESDEEYVPLNDGFNWKGDPNATITGQDIPQFPPGVVGVAEYNPATGTYVGPDGVMRRQSNLAKGAQQGQSLESMLVPQAGLQ
ncbi:mammalian cell entry protein [Mycolicibacter terrae]|uniref:Mammalian cell entry protein n=1 Tax=Mycolicibacter terrae TaxID=1788 RepID=A0AAD1MGA1_9MYCO|nr:mammalian cell entry protein [Mycolicibacter terrae]SNV76819.1 virulence factor Mce [Mycolicibacter terrae]